MVAAENAANFHGVCFRTRSWRLKVGCRPIVWSLTRTRRSTSGLETQFQLAKINKQISRSYVSWSRLSGICGEPPSLLIDQELRMDRHIGKLSQSCFHQLRQLRTVRQSLSDTAAKMLIYAFGVTRIDYCNIVLTGASASKYPDDCYESWTDS